MKKFITVLALIMVSIISLTGCSAGFRFLNDNEILDLANPTGKIYLCIYDEETDEYYESENCVDGMYYVFEFELYYKAVPNTVANFIKLVNDGFYDGLAFEDLTGWNTPFVTFGQKEFYEDIIYDEKDEEKEIRKDYYKKLVEPEFNIVGEFSVNGWDKNSNEAVPGSFIMVRDAFNWEKYNKDKNTNFNTAYAAFNIQALESRIPADKRQYEESFCVFGQITRVPSGVKCSPALIEQELLDFFFDSQDHNYSPEYNYSTDVKISRNQKVKFMIGKIEMDNPTVNYGNPLRVKV